RQRQTLLQVAPGLLPASLPGCDHRLHPQCAHQGKAVVPGSCAVDGSCHDVQGLGRVAEVQVGPCQESQNKWAIHMLWTQAVEQRREKRLSCGRMTLQEQALRSCGRMTSQEQAV